MKQSLRGSVDIVTLMNCGLARVFGGLRGVVFCLCLFAAAAFAGQPKGVVLVIADGTSMELITATRIYKNGANSRLSFETMPHTAFVRTVSADGMITDSGAGATAMARGFKALNTVVGAAAPGQPSQPSILDLAKKAGWNTGVISDDSVTGATPSSFVIEHPNRREEYVIANKEIRALGKNLDFLFGGGSRFFEGEFSTDGKEAKFAPVFEETKQLLGASNIRYFNSWDKFVAEKPKDLSRPILGVFHPNVFPYIADGPRKPALEDMVREGLTLLQNAGKPYIFIIEAGLPDKAAHQNQAKRAMEEVLVFERTLEFLRQNVGPDVLLLATTDHETGGLAISPGQPVSAKGDQLLKPSPITKIPVLTWATGPGGGDPSVTPTPVANVDPLAPSAMQPALLKTGAAFHSGGDVWMLGEGPGSEKVTGFLDNTDTFKIMAAAIK
ncbi:MAG TPA: alkaline phosphatase [Chthoniobacterales bacterium]